MNSNLNYQDLPENLKAISTRFAIFGSLRILGGLALLLFITPHIFALNPWSLILIMPLLGALIYKLTIVMHECAHRTFFHSPRLNQALGWFCGALLLSDFNSFTKLHWEHHRQFGTPKDPQGRDYIGYAHSSRKQLAIHLLRPIIGYNLFKVATFRSPNPDTSTEVSSKTISRVKLITAAGILQLGIIAAVTNLAALPWLALIYPTSAATFALFFSQIRGFCEHVPPTTLQDEKFVRTHLTHWWEKIWLYDLNFNYHVEHHRYPQLPACHLPAVHSLIHQQFTAHEGLSQSMFKTITHKYQEAQ